MAYSSTPPTGAPSPFAADARRASAIERAAARWLPRLNRADAAETRDAAVPERDPLEFYMRDGWTRR